MKMLYVSGAMTAHQHDLDDPWHFKEFNRVAELLRREGYAVINPADKGVIDGWTWAQYLKYDLAQVMRCDGVATLDGWEASKGARLEVVVAEGLEIPVLPYQQWMQA